MTEIDMTEILIIMFAKAMVLLAFMGAIVFGFRELFKVDREQGEISQNFPKTKKGLQDDNDNSKGGTNDTDNDFSCANDVDK